MTEPKKQHAPIEQLRESAKEAERLLRERGIHTAESAIDRILAENKVVLPGIPAYLPHRGTLQLSRRYMKDILRIWEKQNKKEKKQEDTQAFFRFLVEELNDLEGAAQRKVDKMPAILRAMNNVNIPLFRVFSVWQQFETIQAITRFMVDSFAVSMIVKEHHTTTEFAEWFMKWTLTLEALWIRNEEKDGKPTLGKLAE